VTEIRDDLGQLVGGLTLVPVPGSYLGVFAHRMTYVGWAQDWEADNPEGHYLPVFLGQSEDPDELVAEIEKRARQAVLPEGMA
jgi:hypothetical protein